MSSASTSPLPPLADGVWRVIYFDAPNRGEQLRLLFALTGTTFDDCRLPFPDGKVPLIAAGDANPLAFDLTPIVQHGNISIGIVPGSMLYTAEKLGLIPDDLLARALAVSIVDASEMMRNDVFYKVFFERAKLRRAPEPPRATVPHLAWPFRAPVAAQGCGDRAFDGWPRARAFLPRRRHQLRGRGRLRLPQSHLGHGSLRP